MTALNPPPFDEIDLADLQASGFSISDDHRRARLETACVIEVTKAEVVIEGTTERHTQLKLLVRLPSGATLECCEYPEAVLMSDAEIEQTIGDLDDDDRYAAYVVRLREILNERKARRQEQPRRPVPPQLRIVE